MKMDNDMPGKKGMVTDFSKQELCFKYECKRVVVPLRERNKTNQGAVRIMCTANVNTEV